MKIIPIGGLNEIGKNMTVLEYRDQILVIDCGMSFPDDDMFGIDVVIPDFTYLIENKDKIRGVVITHGHEDHIGGVPYLLNQIQVPIYGTALSIGLIRNKLDEHGLKGDLRLIHAGDTLHLGDFTVRIYRTTHSIADSICLCVDTPAARIFHTGDFKIDYTPVDGEPIDFAALAELGKSGVDILLADSTNATRKGFTPSERMVRETLDNIFRDVEKRIIIATFSSNVHRVQSIIDLSVKYGRKFTVSGRSMENVMSLATELGYLKYPKNSFVELSKTKNIPDNELTIITTGSQGEPLSALARMAAGEHRNVKLKKGDTVILSSSPVPGNEKSVSNVVNKLFEKEVNVIYKDVADIHVSGHACQEDLKLMHSLIRPKYFMPVHGEPRHLIMHAKLAEELGMKKDDIFILNNGDQLTIDKRRAIKFKNVVPAEDIMVDSFGSGDVGSAVLKDRRLLSESGMLLAVAAVDRKNGIIVSGPEIVTRGFVYVKDNEELINGAKKQFRHSLEKNLKNGVKDWKVLKSNVHDDLRNYIFMKTRKSPLIFPVFLDV
ncbi:MAG: ribonuclease J [Eubacteriales bacterium]|nr:ribonuclease J [Eubacteriales bacterium]